MPERYYLKLKKNNFFLMFLSSLSVKKTIVIITAGAKSPFQTLKPFYAGSVSPAFLTAWLTEILGSENSRYSLLMDLRYEVLHYKPVCNTGIDETF
jgi:hypothetical protein